MKISNVEKQKAKFIVTVKGIIGVIRTEYTGAFEDYIIFDEHYKKLKVRTYNEDYLLIESDGGIVERNTNGSVNLLAKAPSEFLIHKGSEIKLGLQMTDISCSIEIYYEGLV